MATKTLITFDELWDQVTAWRQAGETVGLVPTMGALHDGHLSLMSAARQRCDRVLATIFVNPTQFGPNEDFAKYPRTLADDIEKLSQAAIEAAFVPNTSDIYQEGHQTTITNGEMALGLCGGQRPGHFDGVLTIVLKLFNLCQADAAFFGKKDYQQLKVIVQMARDLNVPTEVVGCEIVREPDGLAMSSRNRYLSENEREQAVGISKALQTVQEAYHTNVRSRDQLYAAFDDVISEYPGLSVEYRELRSQARLATVTETTEEPLVLMVAVNLAATRLIDNIELG